MKREEEMWKAVADEHGELSRRESFITLTAMEWADKTMLDRACEWLGNELKETDDKNGYPTVESRSFVSVKEFINEFRQAMEGGAE